MPQASRTPEVSPSSLGLAFLIRSDSAGYSAITFRRPKGVSFAALASFPLIRIEALATVGFHSKIVLTCIAHASRKLIIIQVVCIMSACAYRFHAVQEFAVTLILVSELTIAGLIAFVVYVARSIHAVREFGDAQPDWVICTLDRSFACFRDTNEREGVPWCAAAV